MKRKALIVLPILLGLILAACMQTGQTSRENRKYSELFVSTGFADKTIYNEKLEVNQGDTVYDLIGRSLKVEAQAGGFITSVNDIKPDKSGGWFYSVNGISSDCSAKDYILKGDEKILWDAHNWSEKTSVQSVAGAYPEPFINGYKGQTKGAVIFYSDDSKKEAETLAKNLEGLHAKKVEVKSLSDAQEIKADRPVIVLGSWKGIEKNSKVKELAGQGTKAGIFARFEAEGIKLLDSNGEAVESHTDNISVIAASGVGFFDPNPVWIITSNDSQGVGKAVELLCKNPEKIKGFFGAAIVNGEVKRLPVLALGR